MTSHMNTPTVSFVEFRPDERFFATAGWDGKVKICTSYTCVPCRLPDGFFICDLV
jgi:hypothetical protein